MDDLWKGSRGGSHAGRGFHYQDAVATELAVRAWTGELPFRRLVPEGLDDISIEFDDRWLHLQAKSRREHRGEFALGDFSSVWPHLAERLLADPDARAGLVLERPLCGIETGLDGTLAEAAIGPLKEAIGRAVSGMSVDEFLARTCIVVTPADQSTAVRLLAEKLNIAPATCAAHCEAIRSEMVRLADENGVRDADDPAATTVGEIGRIIDDVSEAVDSSALNEATRDGLCEPVDFATAVADEQFFSGVDVVVGHVVAGLPLERRELSDALAAALATHGSALAVGPSGCGKSALIWMTTYETRHLVRWYRVRRLRPEDVTPLIRLAKGLLVSPTARVGFVCDDLGRQDRLGFDALCEEARGLPGTLLLGACRQENLILVRSAHRIAQVRPELDEATAQGIWADLRKRGETDWAEWREPFTQSRGLLLEYGHLLTSGERLETTITAQVEERFLESNRGVELDSLTLVAAAAAYGGELDAVLLAGALNADAPTMKLALARLVDEHLISQRDGMLGGLHELRSQHITQAIHRTPPPRLVDTMRRVIGLVGAAALQTLLVRALLDGTIDDDAAIAAVAARITGDEDPNVLAAALHAMRLVGLWRTTRQWRELFDATRARPADAFLIAHFVAGGGDASLFPAPLQRAVTEASKVPIDDLREPLLARIAPHVGPSLAATRDVGVASSVLAACGEIGTEIDIDADALIAVAEAASLADLRLLLEAAYAAAPRLAIDLVDSIGGSTALLERVERELPWVRNAQLGTSDDGESTVEAKYAYMVESAQPPAHEAVMDLVGYLAAFAPSATTIICTAIDATGDAAGLGMALADKAIPRENLPSKASICWSRARSRAAVAAVAAATATEHQLAAREDIVATSKLVRRAGDSFVSGRAPTSQLKALLHELVRSTGERRPAPIALEAPGPLDEGELPIKDPAGDVAATTSSNLIPRLFRGENVAPLAIDLARKTRELSAPEWWRFVDEPPFEDLAELQRSLRDLHDVVAEQQLGDRRAIMALRAAGRKGGLGAAATDARRRSHERMNAVAESVTDELARHEIHAHVLVRDIERESDRPTQDELLALIEVASMIEWRQRLATTIDLCRPLLGDRVALRAAPVRDERIVSSSAVRVLKSVYPDDTLRTWPGLPFRLLDETLGDSLRSGLQGLVEVSGIIATAHKDGLNDAEEAAFSSAVENKSAALENLRQLWEATQDPVLAELLGVFAALHGLIQNEAAALAEGSPIHGGLAASMIAGNKGTPNETYNTVVGALAFAAEWDVDPLGARTLLEQPPE